MHLPIHPAFRIQNHNQETREVSTNLRGNQLTQNQIHIYQINKPSKSKPLPQCATKKRSTTRSANTGERPVSTTNAPTPGEMGSVEAAGILRRRLQSRSIRYASNVNSIPILLRTKVCGFPLPRTRPVKCKSSSGRKTEVRVISLAEARPASSPCFVRTEAQSRQHRPQAQNRQEKPQAQNERLDETVLINL